LPPPASDPPPLAPRALDAARRYVPAMRAGGADLVVAVAHSGLSPAPARGMDENAAAYLAQVPGIDAILAGHSHLVFPDPSFAALPGVDVARGTINGVPTVMAGFWGSHLGVVDLTLRRTASGWERIDGTGSTRGIRRREENRWVPAVQPDPAIEALIQAEHAGTGLEAGEGKLVGDDGAKARQRHRQGVMVENGDPEQGEREQDEVHRDAEQVVQR